MCSCTTYVLYAIVVSWSSLSMQIIYIIMVYFIEKVASYIRYCGFIPYFHIGHLSPTTGMKLSTWWC